MARVGQVHHFLIRVNRSQLIQAVAGKTGYTQFAVREILEATLREIERQMPSQRVVIQDFGSFSLRPYKAAVRINPKNGQPMVSPAHFLPTFRPSKALRERLAGTEGES